MEPDAQTKIVLTVVRDSSEMGKHSRHIGEMLKLFSPIVRSLAGAIRECPHMVDAVQPATDGLTALREAMAGLASDLDQYQAAIEAAKGLQQ